MKPSALARGAATRLANIDMRWFLGLLALAYAVAYARYPAAPGNSAAHPLGWWGWFDQGQYLMSAKAFATFDFAPDKHFYPPLYPLLGALFLGLTPSHPFWLIDLLGLLWFAYVFVRAASLHVPRGIAMLLFIATTVASSRIFENFVIPWTSTLSAALLSTGIYALVRLEERARADDGAALRPAHAFAISCALGLIATLRPIDAVVGGVLWLGWLAMARSVFPGGFHRFTAIAAAGLLIGPLCFVCYNLAVFGSPLGGYVRTSISAGYAPADLGEKFVSIFLDGYSLYLEPKAGLLDRYPWLLLALPATAYVAARTRGPLRVVALAIAAHYALYLPYGDLLPNGLWRYLNVHYFKWTFPYLALFTCCAPLGVARSWRSDRRIAVAWCAFFAVAVVLLLSARLHVDATTLAVDAGAADATVTLRGLPATVDLIDVHSLQGGFNEIYFGEHALLLDGRALQRVRDFRLLPAPWGVRILFIRPVRGETVILRGDPRLARAATGLSASAGSYRIALGKPKPWRKETDAVVATPYVPGEDISFAGDGARCAEEGWSTPEAWGTWSVGDKATLRLKLSPPAQSVTLRMRLSAYVNDRHPRQRVDVEVNGVIVRHLEFRATEDGGIPRDETFTAAATTDGELRIALITPDAAAPSELGLSADGRKLGVGVVSLRIEAR